jgi:hypothetical protein
MLDRPPSLGTSNTVSQVPLWLQAPGDRCMDHVLKGATHRLVGQDKLIEELADLLVVCAERL